MSKLNCHIRKWFSEILLAVEMNKKEVKMDKPV